MTREQLDALEKLLSTTTPAPWWAQREYDGGRTVCQMRHQTETVCINRAVHVEGAPWEAHWANANLIQDLRNNAAELIAQAREALELREALEYLCSTPMSSTCGPGHVKEWKKKPFVSITKCPHKQAASKEPTA